MNDGGAAFPLPAYLDAPDGKGTQIIVMESNGMSLRDWFAGMALTGLLADRGGPRYNASTEKAYAIADAMLEERMKPKP